MGLLDPAHRGHKNIVYNVKLASIL
jgi:hypothetical protein